MSIRSVKRVHVDARHDRVGVEVVDNRVDVEVAPHEVGQVEAFEDRFDQRVERGVAGRALGTSPVRAHAASP